jgi:hypothetical protein
MPQIFQVLVFDFSWERISQDLMTFVVSVVDGVPVDSEFIGMSVCAL